MTAESKHKTSTTSKEEESLPSIDERNWRGIGISLVVIVSISSLIALAILLLSPKATGDRVKRERFYLADVVSGNFTPRNFNGSWVSGKGDDSNLNIERLNNNIPARCLQNILANLSDNELVFRNSDGHLVLYSLDKEAQSILVPNSTLDENAVHKYSISSNLEHVLLGYDEAKVYRHTNLARYKIYHVTSKISTCLTPREVTEAHLQYAAWGPQGTQLVYVYKNNIYYLSHVNDTDHRAITTDGEERVIFNGVPDWLYEEEILGLDHAIWFSKDGSHLCFAAFDDSKVDTFYYSWYGKMDEIYPQLRDLRYPKAGRKNPTVTLWVVDLRSRNFTRKNVEPPEDIKDTEHYVTSVQWIEGNRLVIIWSKRSQNHSVVSVCYGANWSCKPVYVSKLPHKKGWVEMTDDPVVTTMGNVWFLKLPFNEGSYGTYKHVAKLDLNDDNRVTYLTHGRYDITKIIGYSATRNEVYYQSTKEGAPAVRHIYSVFLNKINDAYPIQCLTCNIGDDCKYNNAYMNPSATHFIMECLGPKIPRTDIRSVDNGTLIKTLDDNSDLREKNNSRASPEIEIFEVELDGDYRAQVKLFLPPGLDKTEKIFYPLVVQTYAGPGSQIVSEKMDVHWGTYLSSRLNYIYAMIDGRGTGFQGDKMQQEIYYKIGTVEVEDQIKVVEYLLENLTYIDAKHVAIWGWSYGGYVSASAISHENSLFHCAVSVAPVTNWLYYDSAYVERYMGSPDPTDNYLGYERSNLLKRANDFRQRRILLVHGTADDNVHFQHTMMFVKALKDANVLFQLQVYPDEGHSLKNVKMHLYKTMEEFLKECFYVQPKDELEATRVKKDVKGR